MAELKMLRQVMTTTELFSHGEAICDMLREQYGTYDADSLEEVVVDDTFVQRLKAKGYEVFAEGDPRIERTAPRRPLPRLGLPNQSRAREESGPRVPNRPMNDRASAGPTRPSSSSTPFRTGTGDGVRPADGSFRTNNDGAARGGDGAGNSQRPMRSGGLPLRPAERPATERPAGERSTPMRSVPGAATPVPGVPAAEVPELPTAGTPEQLPVAERAPTGDSTPPPVNAAAPLVEAAPVVEQRALLPDAPVTEPPPAMETAKPASKSRPRAPKVVTPAPVAEGTEAEAPLAKPRRNTRKRVEPPAE